VSDMLILPMLETSTSTGL